MNEFIINKYIFFEEILEDILLLYFIILLNDYEGFLGCMKKCDLSNW